MDHEAFESGDAGLDEIGQFRRITVHHAAPGCPVDPGIAASRGALGVEGCDTDYFGYAVEGHVDEGSDTARGCGAGRGIEALPVSARIVDVDVRIDEAGEQEQVVKVMACAATAIAPGPDGGDLSAVHVKRGGVEAVGRQNAS